MNQRGQFFIVAAVLIAVIVSSLASVTTYAYTRSAPTTIYEVSAELREESSRIVEYGIYTEQDINTVLTDFTEGEFADYFIPKVDETAVVFIYGTFIDEEALVFSVRFDFEKRGEILSNLLGSSAIDIKDAIITRENIVSLDGQVSVTLLEKDYVFDLKPGENFYFIIGHSSDDEVYIEKSLDEIGVA